jgi:F-type H+-transporting ATPase subunit c
MFLADVSMNGMQIAAGLVGMGAAVGIGLVGGKAVESIGRNPGTFNLVLVMGLISMALAEGLAILVYFVVKL